MLLPNSFAEGTRNHTVSSFLSSWGYSRGMRSEQKCHADDQNTGRCDHQNFRAVKISKDSQHRLTGAPNPRHKSYCPIGPVKLTWIKKSNRRDVLRPSFCNRDGGIDSPRYRAKFACSRQWHQSTAAIPRIPAAISKKTEPSFRSKRGWMPSAKIESESPHPRDQRTRRRTSPTSARSPRAPSVATP
jgi:hypothetical protein